MQIDWTKEACRSGCITVLWRYLRRMGCQTGSYFCITSTNSLVYTTRLFLSAVIEYRFVQRSTFVSLCYRQTTDDRQHHDNSGTLTNLACLSSISNLCHRNLFIVPPTLLYTDVTLQLYIFVSLISLNCVYCVGTAFINVLGLIFYYVVLPRVTYYLLLIMARLKIRGRCSKKA